jgi:hypothetical protein
MIPRLVVPLLKSLSIHPNQLWGVATTSSVSGRGGQQPMETFPFLKEKINK